MPVVARTRIGGYYRTTVPRDVRNWRYGFYGVRMLECPRCRNVFNYYEGTSPRGRHTVFVVKVRPRR